MRKTVASVLVIFMALFMFAGCGSKTLEQKVKPADLQKMVDEMKENSLFKSVYKDAAIEVKGNDVTYKYYYKQEFLLPVWGLTGRKKKLRRNCIAYIMHEYRYLGEPDDEYYNLLDSGYERWGFDKDCLVKAIEDSIGRQAAAQWLSEYYNDNDEEDEEHE